MNKEDLTPAQQKVISKFFNEGVETVQEYQIMINIWSARLASGEEQGDVQIKLWKDLESLV